METISYEEFKKMDVRVGTIRFVEPVPETDKLLRCEVDFGETDESGAPKTRQIVSGIREFVPEYETLIGRQLLYIINLEPRTIKGVQSEGMLLAVGESDPTFLIPERTVPPGARIR